MPDDRSKPSESMLSAGEIEEVFRRLKLAMPGRTRDAKGPKGQPDAFRSCVSCMLSAQSKDENTAKAARQLFALADTPQGILALDDAEITDAIRPAGLYNMKTRNIRSFCKAVLALNGKIPDDRSGLMSLPGIGRKCADIVLSFTFGKDVIAVDTHVHRVANRIGIAKGKTEDQTASSLEKNAPDWAMHDGHFWLLQFGKSVCKSRNPQCDECPVNDLCLWFSANRRTA